MLARKQIYIFFAAAALALGPILNLPAMAENKSKAVGKFSADDARSIEQIVREYIISHPEIIDDAVQTLRVRQRQTAEKKLREMASNTKRVGSEDHVLGDRNAKVKLVEFSDFECPFCKRVHPTLKKIMAEYGDSGKVAWVYRQFPLDSLHKKARKEAQASECANELGGNDAFWAFTDRLFKITPSNDRFDLSLLPKVAEDIGLDRAKFEDCLKGDMRGGKYAEHIEADYQDATASGGDGTPYFVIIGPNGDTFPISGAQPYSAFKAIIEVALAKK